jgi:DNA-directed RNA polymerase subunit RPC12/RpoP
MDSQGATFSFTGHHETDNIATVHAPNVAEEEKKSTAVMLEEDRVNQMTLNIGTVPDTIQSQNTKVVTQQPRATLRMKPENYVIGLEHLQEAPEYIDCPYCKSRQKTKVRHESTSQTTYVIPSM